MGDAGWVLSYGKTNDLIGILEKNSNVFPIAFFIISVMFT